MTSNVNIKTAESFTKEKVEKTIRIMQCHGTINKKGLLFIYIWDYGNQIYYFPLIIFRIILKNI